ncbi:hypothetical protein [Desulfitobacterium hafniense]|uniref:hypothetical protein n=1 Tax=Desulfitobacterium hafniense TaxID=49338 RepID=UPI001F6096E5|nr:hypothetical protein [Desulfitobacterium hafniense]
MLFFRSVSIRMAQKRLLKLVEGKRIKRNRLSIDEPYFYYLDKRPGQVEHRLGVNWVYVWRRIHLHGWEKLHSFEWEVTFKKLRADALLAVRNLAHNSFDFTFIEFDIVGSGNPFDKVSKYNELYESGEWLHTWWGEQATGFPRILIVTTGRVDRIQAMLKDNRNNLEFVIRGFEQIKEECTHGSSRSASIWSI